MSVFLASLFFNNALFKIFFERPAVGKVVVGMLVLLALGWLAKRVWGIDPGLHIALLVFTGVAAVISLFVVGAPLAYVVAVYISSN